MCQNRSRVSNDFPLILPEWGSMCDSKELDRPGTAGAFFLQSSFSRLAASPIAGGDRTDGLAIAKLPTQRVLALVIFLTRTCEWGGPQARARPVAVPRSLEYPNSVRFCEFFAEAMGESG